MLMICKSLYHTKLSFRHQGKVRSKREYVTQGENELTHFASCCYYL